ncbi:MAG: hypothetical protein WCP53_07155, partial [Verrucomicrobiota bacterium]
MKRFLLVFSLFASVLSAVAQGTINAKNSGSLSPLLAANGSKLSAATGRFEVLLGDRVLSTAKNTLAVDGVFTAGVLPVPGVAAGGTATITVHAWDTGAGATYALAQAAGFGFGSSTFQVTGLGGDLSPPPALDNFKGIRLADRSIVVGGTFNAKNSSALSPLLSPDGSRLPVTSGRVELLFNDTVLNTVEKTLVIDGVFSLGVLTVPGVAAGGNASITVRAWDTRAGATYALAQAAGSGFGSATFSVGGLGGGLTAPPAMENFKGIRLSSGITTVAGTFNAKNSATASPLLAADGSKLTVANGRFEILFGDTLLSMLNDRLDVDGVFSDGVLSVPGVPVGGTAAITIRAWDVGAGATYALAQ